MFKTPLSDISVSTVVDTKIEFSSGDILKTQDVRMWRSEGSGCNSCELKVCLNVRRQVTNPPANNVCKSVITNMAEVRLFEVIPDRMYAEEVILKYNNNNNNNSNNNNNNNSSSNCNICNVLTFAYIQDLTGLETCATEMYATRNCLIILFSSESMDNWQAGLS
jgi:hypothetical protein